jgi:hypothetical protein
MYMSTVPHAEMSVKRNQWTHITTREAIVHTNTILGRVRVAILE